MTNNREVGKRAERFAAKLLSEIFGRPVIRSAQANGKLSSDLLGIPGLHLEVKRRTSFAVEAHLEQAEGDCDPLTETPVVILVPKGNPDGAMVLVRATDLIRFACIVVPYPVQIPEKTPQEIK